MLQSVRSDTVPEKTSTTSSPGNQPPAKPAYILRGHVSAVQAVHFFHANAYVASGDAKGWLVVWSLASKRPVTVWRAHEGSILGMKDWGGERLITHGRDHKLRVWQLKEDDFATLDTRLPVEDPGGAQTRKEPWLLHSMCVNALNFCAFGMCYDISMASKYAPKTLPEADDVQSSQDGSRGEKQVLLRSKLSESAIIIAVPNALDSGGIDFFDLPSEHRRSTLRSDDAIKTGMVMSLAIFHHSLTGQLTIVSGYEDGHTMVHMRHDLQISTDPWVWKRVHASRPHSQPLLSLDITPDTQLYITSSADANLARFSVPYLSKTGPSETTSKIVNTKHAGQQSLRVRSDGKIFAAAGWDARVRVYSTKTMRELAVLKWHKDGSYAVAFADVRTHERSSQETKEATAAETSANNSESALDVIKRQRSLRAQTTHWLAAGGKDGKISLWDVY